MSSRVRPLLLVAALLQPSILVGQHAARLRVRADSLLLEWQQANALAAVQDSLRHAAQIAGRDTVRAGALTILMNPSPLPLARAAARAWPQIERFYGSAAQALARHPLVIEAVDPDTTEPPRSSGALQIFWDMDEDVLTRVLVGLADLSDVDPALRDWLGGGVSPVSTPARAARRCTWSSSPPRPRRCGAVSWATGPRAGTRCRSPTPPTCLPVGTDRTSAACS